MKLKELCQNQLKLHKAHQDLAVTGLAIDSRQVKAGYVFFALPGTQYDGLTFIPDAIENGAVAILCEESANLFTQADVQTHAGRNIPIYSVPHLYSKVGEFASRFYKNPSHQFDLIGVTGTNGKSSTTYFIASALNLLDKKTALLGTLGNGLIDNLILSTHTTLNPIHLQQCLSSFGAQHVDCVTMEVSSHGLSQHRVKGCNFDIACFTNLSHEHLDYHGDMHRYGQAKRKLFHMKGLRYAVINVDDNFGKVLYKDCEKRLDTIAITLNPQLVAIDRAHLISAEVIAQSVEGLHFKVATPWGKGALHTKLLGQFNIYNLLMVIACLGIMQTPWQKILSVIEKLSGVPGRMEVFSVENNPKVVIDYAHTPDALESALMALIAHKFGAVWCVFGCGGDRDKDKRPMMGEIAEKYADHIIITNDNPRSENPTVIADEISQGLKGIKEHTIILDRKKAIETAVEDANKNDVILIAGKGHENYQEIAGTKYHFSDSEIVSKILNIKKQEAS